SAEGSAESGSSGGTCGAANVAASCGKGAGSGTAGAVVSGPGTRSAASAATYPPPRSSSEATVRVAVSRLRRVLLIATVTSHLPLGHRVATILPPVGHTSAQQVDRVHAPAGRASTHRDRGGGRKG